MEFQITPKPGSPGLLWAYWKLWSAKLTGLLTIEWDRFKKQIVLRRGEPISARSNWMAETFGQYLLKLGKIDRAILDEELKKEGEKIPLGERLVGRGLLSGAEMLELLTTHFQDRLFNLLTLSRGQIEFKELAIDHPALQDHSTKLTENFERILWAETKKAFTSAICKDKLSPFFTQEGQLNGEFVLPLSPQELRAWNALKSRPLQVGALDEISLRLVAAATEFELVVWKQKNTAKLQEELAKLEERVKASTPFEILGVVENASIDECKKMFLELVKRFHPDRLPPSELPEVKKRAETLFAKINEAYSTVTDPERRKEYEARIEIEKQGGMEAIHQRLQAEMLIPQIKMGLKRRHFKAALDQLREIEKILKDDAEVHADRIYAEIMVMIEAKQDIKPKMAAFQKELSEACKKRANYASAFFYMGLLLKMDNKNPQALQFFEKALQIDPKLNEAASEARLLRTRMEKKK